MNSFKARTLIVSSPLDSLNWWLLFSYTESKELRHWKKLSYRRYLFPLEFLISVLRMVEGTVLKMSFKSNISNHINASTAEYCLDCKPENGVIGFRPVSLVVFIFLSLMYGISAIGGKVALLAALNRTESFRGRPNNYYIVSLAIADLFIGLTMTPLCIYYALVYYPPWLVKLEGFLWIVTVTATTYSLSAVSLDRFISVVYPLHYPQVVTEKRCQFVICLIWVGSIIFGFPRLVLNDFVKLEKLWIACSVATVAIPLLIMCLSYGKIFLVVRKANRSMSDHTSQFSSATLANRKAALTIGIIVTLFTITFIPTAVVYFMLLLEDDPCKELELNGVWLWVALVSFTYSSFNPWVYGLRYRELRKAIKYLFLNNNA